MSCLGVVGYVLGSGHFWVKRGRDTTTSSNINFQVPDIATPPTWTFDNALNEQVRHSPLIDSEKNVYILTTTRLRKFTPKGELAWTFTQRGKMTTSPTLHGDLIYLASGVAHGTQLWALNIQNASIVWEVNMPEHKIFLDSQGLTVVKDTLLAPVMLENPEADSGWMAINASTGAHLWDYGTDQVVWNAVPTALDDSLLFATTCGGVFRISLEGKTLWRAGERRPGTCSTGGGGLGENGIFYSEYTLPDASGIPNGHVAAYRASDGHKLWQKDFGPKYLGMQYPSIGRLGPKGKLAVVVAIGQNPGMPNPLPLLGGARDRYFTDEEYRLQLGAKPQVNAVVALDAETGDQIWRWEEEPWTHFGAAGDEEGFLERAAKNDMDGSVCLPDLQGIPVINSFDGTVFASSSHGGNLTAINDANGDGIIDKSEVKSFAPGVAFLNSPSMAPGMIVAAPCWGPTYVWVN